MGSSYLIATRKRLYLAHITSRIAQDLGEELQHHQDDYQVNDAGKAIASSAKTIVRSTGVLGVIHCRLGISVVAYHKLFLPSATSVAAETIIAADDIAEKF